MTCTYAGVNLPTPSPEGSAWLAQHLSLRDLVEFGKWAWPGKNRTHWTFPGFVPDRPVKLNTLWWPRDASRFAVAHFLATDADLALIRSVVYPGSSYAAAPLVIDDEAGGTITTDLWMLPPRPLAQLTGLPAPEQELYLLTLVDERFWWQYKNTGDVNITEGEATWEDLFLHAEAALGVIISRETTDAAYLGPCDGLSNHYENAALFLDVLAYNTGQRVVRLLDGTVKCQLPAVARLAALTQYALAGRRRFGGKFKLDVTDTPDDLRPVLPESVTVTFPRLDDCCPNGVYAKVIPFTGLAIPVAPDTATFGGTKTFHDCARADYTGGASYPDNQTELDSLAQRVATDWYQWQTSSLWVRFAGIPAWQPEAWSDSVEWEFRPDDVGCWVRRPAWNDLTEELLHGLATACAPPPGTITQVIFDVRCEGGILNVYVKDHCYEDGRLVHISEEYFDHEAGCCDCQGSGSHPDPGSHASGSGSAGSVTSGSPTSGSGGGGVTTLCCPGVALPLTLNLNIQPRTTGCPCLNNRDLTLTYNGGNGRWEVNTSCVTSGAGSEAVYLAVSCSFVNVWTLYWGCGGVQAGTEITNGPIQPPRCGPSPPFLVTWQVVLGNLCCEGLDGRILDLTLTY